MANEGYGNYETTAPQPEASEPRSPKAPSEAGSSEHSARPASSMPAAGPHAEPELTNHAATPGSGALPEGPAPGDDVDPAAG
jgi:hypothetical protein